jgi:hypothetical protein
MSNSASPITRKQNMVMTVDVPSNEPLLGLYQLSKMFSITEEPQLEKIITIGKLYKNSPGKTVANSPSSIRQNRVVNSTKSLSV